MNDVASRIQSLSSDKRQIALRSLPAYLRSAKKTDELAQVLSDVSFVEAAVNAGFLYQLLIEYAAALSIVPFDHPNYASIQLLKRAIQSNADFIANNPTCLFQCIWNSSVESAKSPGTRNRHTTHSAGQIPPLTLHDQLLSRLAAKYQSDSDFKWLRSLRPSLIPADGRERTVLYEFVDKLLFSPNGARVLATSELKGAVFQWDVATGLRFVVHHMPGSDFLAAVLSPNESLMAIADDESFSVDNLYTLASVCILDERDWPNSSYSRQSNATALS